MKRSVRTKKVGMVMNTGLKKEDLATLDQVVPDFTGLRNDSSQEYSQIQWSHSFQKYPHLINLEELVEKYPWTETRITYNAVYTSYRKPCNCAASCVLSLTTSHNELVNAWTHIFGFLAALGCLLTTLCTASPERVGATAVLSLFAAGGMFMFSSSAMHHTFCCHSDMGSRTVQCMDWLGIAVFTFVSNLVVSYFEIFDYGYENVFYGFTAANFLLAMFSYYVTFSALQTVYKPFNKATKHSTNAKEDGEKKEKTSNILFWLLKPLFDVMNTYIFRTSVGMMYALGSMLAWIIGYALTGKVNNHLVPIIGMYLCFGTVVFCLLDFPEAFFPKGTFDIVGASHQLFHVGIIGGFLLLWAFFYKVSL